MTSIVTTGFPLRPFKFTVIIIGLILVLKDKGKIKRKGKKIGYTLKDTTRNTGATLNKSRRA